MDLTPDRVREVLVAMDESTRVMLAGAVANPSGAAPASASTAPDKLVQPLLALATTKAKGASLVSPQIAIPALALVAAGVGLRNANRAMENREALARTLIADRQAATVTIVVESLTESLDFTRDRLHDLLSAALGIDDQEASAAALQQRIADADRARTRMLRALGG